MSIIRPSSILISENTPRSEIDIYNLFKEKLNDDYYVKYAGVIKKPIGWTNFFIVILLSQISAHHWFDKII